MARVLRWQEKLVLAFAALLFSVTSGLGTGPRDSASAHRASSSRVVIVGKSGIERKCQPRRWPSAYGVAFHAFQIGRMEFPRQQPGLRISWKRSGQSVVDAKRGAWWLRQCR